MRNFIGKGDFLWFVGVVEDRNDPVKMGRVRVRCFGWHTDDKTQIPTDHLPWAVVINNTNSASVNGVGDSPTGMVEGTWVVGFFLDGERAQEPAIFGTLPGLPSEMADTSKGFYDPFGLYPKYTGEPDVNRLARGTQIWQYEPDATIGEPADPYAAQYPKNHVYESESGHTKEYDDTPGFERIKESHMSGTFYEVHPIGDKVQHIVGSDYKVVAYDNNLHVYGNVNIFVDGAMTISSGGTCSISSDTAIVMSAPTIDLN